MKQMLNNQKWHLKGFWPYVPLLHSSVETRLTLKGVTEWMDAEVPGSVFRDLLNSGYIDDPYKDDNSIRCEWVSNRWWMYRLEFDLNQDMTGNKLNLVFEGLDYKAHILLNGVTLGVHEGMFLKACFDISSLVRDEGNELEVILEHAPDEQSQIGMTELTHTQKSRFNYKWDFSTRLVNLGLYGDVYIESAGITEMSDIHIATNVVEGQGKIDLSYDLMLRSDAGLTLNKVLTYKRTTVFKDAVEKTFVKGNHSVRESILVDDPQMWYPNGLGEQALYELALSVLCNGEITEKKTYQVGIRSLRYEWNESAPEDSKPYRLIINGEPVYIKGVNMVPLDHLIGTVTRSDYEEVLSLVEEANINLIRVWGGGVIERRDFYDLCDKKGIMVWQEFIQSSSGISNVPSTKPEYLHLMEKVAVEAVKEKRNHVSLTFWSGGNELADAEGIPVTEEDENIQILKKVIGWYDPDRLFLPTSACGPHEFLDISKKGKNYDVHGPWKFEGVREHYHLFNESDSLLHSEFGVDGMSGIESLKGFLSEEHMVLTNMEENLIWRHHGEWWDTYWRDHDILGHMECLEELIACSQFIQAEGIRYALEANRRRRDNYGSIIWQFNEPWPNVSCTSVVDYYRQPKMAYYYMKDAYRNVHVSLKYERLIYKTGDSFEADIYIHNDAPLGNGHITYEIMNHCGQIMDSSSFDLLMDTYAVMKLTRIKWKVAKSHGAFKINLSLKKEGQDPVTSQYLMLVEDDGKTVMKNMVLAHVADWV